MSNITNLVREFSKSIGLNFDITIVDTLQNNLLGEYVYSDKSIRIGSSNTKREWEKHKHLITYEDFVIVILCHELGHAIDPYNDSGESYRLELDKLLDDALEIRSDDFYNNLIGNIMQYQTEKEVAAWTNGRSFIPESLIDFYDFYNKIALAHNLTNIKKLSKEAHWNSN